jgi:SAM-dependent methyltransferase
MTARHALRLHVGCGLEVLPDWVNADVEPIPGAIRADVHSLPLRDSTFDYVLASHLLEHIPDVKRAITELARVLRPGGTLEIRVPDYRHENAFTDLEHVHFFTPRSLEYFAEGSEKYRHRYPVLFTRVRVEEVRGHGPYPFLPRLLGYFPRMDRLFRDRFGGPIELRFYCVKR